MSDTPTVYDLLDLAHRLGPEDEGIDLSDLDLSAEQMADLRSRASSIRKSCDIVGKALALEWERQEIGTRFIDNHQWWVGGTKTMHYQNEEAALAFAKWLKEQDPETIVAILPKNPNVLRKTPLGGARATFFDDTYEGTERLQNKPI